MGPKSLYFWCYELELLVNKLLIFFFLFSNLYYELSSNSNL